MPLYSEIRILRRAFEDTISILGEKGQRAIISDLESRGIYHSDSEYLELAPVSMSLERFFGNDVAQLLLERVKIKADTTQFK